MRLPTLRPLTLLELQVRLYRIQTSKAAAMAVQDWECAAKLRDSERHVKQQIRQAG